MQVRRALCAFSQARILTALVASERHVHEATVHGRCWWLTTAAVQVRRALCAVSQARILTALVASKRHVHEATVNLVIVIRRAVKLCWVSAAPLVLRHALTASLASRGHRLAAIILAAVVGVTWLSFTCERAHAAAAGGTLPIERAAAACFELTTKKKRCSLICWAALEPLAAYVAALRAIALVELRILRSAQIRAQTNEYSVH